MSGLTFAPCPASRASGTPPNRSVRVVIHGVRLNTDMEGDDDYVPFYDNRADVYGRVTIAGHAFDLPELTDNDSPVWDPQDGTFVAPISANPVPIRIELFEADTGITGSDDEVDINPQGGKRRLDVLFDTCSLLLSGDLPGTTTQVPIESSGTGSSGGTIRLSIGTEDGTPDTVDDVALVELGLVQVIHQPSRLIAGKPAVIMARVANNSATPVQTMLRVRIFGPGVNIHENFPLQLAAGELHKTYLRKANPIILPPSGASYDLNVTATIDDEFSKGLPPSDCRRLNDSVEKPHPVRVVTTRTPTLMWAKVGTGLDVGNYTPDSQFDEIIELGQAFIEATYPVAQIDWLVSPFPLSPPINTVYDWMTAILSFLPYAKSLDPFALVFELNLISAVSGLDMKILGVLPSHDWFSRYDGWGDVTGLSLGQFAPRAVILLPRSGTVPGPPMTLPAHELGHTFGLSVDARLKASWVCDVDWPVVGSLPCGAAGGLDEYKHDDPQLKAGNPASGFWVTQGNEPPIVAGLVSQEQCDSHCFMGSSPADAHLNWAAEKRWIDRADYESLIDRLMLGSPLLQLAGERGAALYVSGLVAWNDEMYVGETVLCDGAAPERTEHSGLYAVRFLDRRGQPISEVGLPIFWNIADYPRPFPITAFATTVPFEPKGDVIEFVNRGTGKRLAKRRIHRSAGSVSVVTPGRDVRVERGTSLALKWAVRSGTGRKTRSVVLVSPDRKTWWPASMSTTSRRHRLDTTVLDPGAYVYKVAVLDGIDVLTSATAQLDVM